MSAKKYANFFESIDKNTPASEYEKYIHKEAIFKDPFHEVKGIGAIYKVFEKMYENLDEPKFKIDEIVEDKDIAYIRWYFSFRFKKQSNIQGFYGVSRVVFKEDKMIFHEDYWDSAQNIYEKIPLISWLIKFVKNKIRG